MKEGTVMGHVSICIQYVRFKTRRYTSIFVLCIILKIFFKLVNSLYITATVQSGGTNKMVPDTKHPDL